MTAKRCVKMVIVIGAVVGFILPFSGAQDRDKPLANESVATSAQPAAQIPPRTQDPDDSSSYSEEIKENDSADSSGRIVLPEEFQDTAFDRFIDLLAAAEALTTRNASLLTDIALQLAEGERVLLRTHSSRIRASDLLRKATTLAVDTNDIPTLDRLARVANGLKDERFKTDVEAARKLAGTSRAVNPELTVSVANVDLPTVVSLKGYINAVAQAELLGNSKALDGIEAELKADTSLSERQRAAVMDLVSAARKSLLAADASNRPLQRILAYTQSELVANRLGAGSRQHSGFGLWGGGKVIDGIPVYKQPDDISCGPTCCAMVLKYYGINAGIGPLKTKARTRFIEVGSWHLGLSLPGGLADAMNAYGVRSQVRSGALQDLVSLIDANRPPIVLVRSSRGTWHYLVVHGYTNGITQFYVSDPSGKSYSMEGTRLDAAWQFSADLDGNPITGPKCQVCGGRGQLWTKCPTCGGTGKWSAFGGWTDCVACSGRGKWSSRCHVCGGDGRVSDVQRKALESVGVHGHTLIVPVRGPAPVGGQGPEVASTNCTSCNGTGYVAYSEKVVAGPWWKQEIRWDRRSRKCQHCNGTGTVQPRH